MRSRRKNPQNTSKFTWLLLTLSVLVGTVLISESMPIEQRVSHRLNQKSLGVILQAEASDSPAMELESAGVPIER